MEEYNYCDEIKNKFEVEELNSKTLSYRINGFIYACNMDLSDSPCVKYISQTRLPYVNKKKEDKDANYNINFALNYDREKGKNVIVIGQYNDLSLMLVNFYDKDKRKDQINEIPFHITLGKVHHEYAYQIDMITIGGSRVKFVMKKSREGEPLPNIITFQTNIHDFSKVLKLVKSFVINPELVFVAYDEMINRKEVVINSKDFSVGLVKDEKLDKPKEKRRKILKKLINND